jgi:DNA-binding transcriptional LysR family regulator
MTVVPDLDIALLRTFVAVVDTGSLTMAGKRVRRTQPAITHQMKRLEGAIGRPLFERDRRSLMLTRDGEVLLEYAHAVLRLNDEARARFAAPKIEGRVVLGTPDLYSAYLLPDILGNFSRAYPRIEIELRCTRSVHLHAALQREEIDIAVMTNQPEFKGGETIRREPLIWVTRLEGGPEAERVLPLAVLPAGSVYRQRALEALGAAGREWSIASISDSIAGLQAAVFAGLAVSVFPQCAVSSTVRRLGKAEGFPELRAVDLVIQRNPQGVSPAAERLAQYIASELRTVTPFRGIGGAG